jgi:hypothetical protein
MKFGRLGWPKTKMSASKANPLSMIVLQTVILFSCLVPSVFFPRATLPGCNTPFRQTISLQVIHESTFHCAVALPLLLYCCWQMTTAVISGIPLTPCALADAKGNSLVMTSAASPLWVERVLRGACEEMGGSAGLATSPMTGATAKRVSKYATGQ